MVSPLLPILNTCLTTNDCNRRTHYLKLPSSLPSKPSLLPSYPKLPFSSPEHDQLFYLVYERVQVVEGSLDPHLWAYRSRITLEHLRQNLQQQNMKKKCPILHAFLQEVCVCVGGGGGAVYMHACVCVLSLTFPKLPLDHFQTPAWLTSSVIHCMQSCMCLSTHRRPT